MGFRFRKSFKVMPGVRLNLSSKGLSTTIGPRGASVNISKRGTYLNTSIPGIGYSKRTKLSSSAPTYSQPRPPMPAIPKTPQPASTRWFSFGVLFAALGAVSSIGYYLEPPDGKTVTLADTAGAVAFWVALGAIWWFVRRALRRSKQAAYERYTANAAAEKEAYEHSLREAELQRQQAAIDAERLKHEQETQRLATYEPQLERARDLYRERIITQEQLFELETYPYKGYYTPASLERSIDDAERNGRAELARQQKIRAKYDAVTAEKILSRRVEVGMTREQLFDALGPTSKTEQTLTKDGERETLIYGSKTAGSYFHIVGGVIVKAVVR